MEVKFYSCPQLSVEITIIDKKGLWPEKGFAYAK